MSKKSSAVKIRKRRESRQQSLDKRRASLRMTAALRERQTDSAAGSSFPNLREEAPIPARNEPCPLHPEYKIKKCPHGCLDRFKQHRNRVTGTVTVIPVMKEDPRAGMYAHEKLSENQLTVLHPGNGE